MIPACKITAHFVELNISVSLIPADAGINDQERSELRAKIAKKIDDAKAWIRANVPDSLLHGGEYRNGALHEAYRYYSDFTRTFVAAVDPFGSTLPIESPWYNAYRTLGFRANEETGRFMPAPYDEFYYR